MDTNNPINDVLQSFANMEDYTHYLTEVEYQFYSADNDAEALRLSFEAKEKGHSHCLFDYVIGFCFNNGKGGISLDKRKAGQFFLSSAEARDTSGNYYNDKHADESRVILAEDLALRNNQFMAISPDKAIEYCNLLLDHERYVDDALLYLTMIYSMPAFGHQNIETAISYCDRLLKTNDPDNKRRAASIRQNLEALRPKGKKSFFGIFGKH